MEFYNNFYTAVAYFYLAYMLIYISYLFLTVVYGAWKLYQKSKGNRVKNELKHDYYVPVSVLVPAHNEEVTIIDSINSLLKLDYKLYEIIVIDDGSQDNTKNLVVEAFEMHKVNHPVLRKIQTKPVKEIYETYVNGIKLTLVSKEGGGKGDALNMGINLSMYPYFLCIDADSMLQRDSLEKIVQPLMEDNNIVAVGGLIHVAQCVEMKGNQVVGYRMPTNWLVAMQVVEYDRSFLGSRILLDKINGNLIISGAFGLFRKDVVIAAGGYDSNTLGEDMELVVKLHVYCRNNNRPYSLRYEPTAVCWSQAPGSLKDLAKQRRRWHLGLFQSMVKYWRIFANTRFGVVSVVSYMYYLLYELLSPVIEIFGIFTMILAWLVGILNVSFMVQFLMLYGVYGGLITITIFFQRVYTHNYRITVSDALRAILVCLLESIFFRYVLSFVRMSAFIGYKNRKKQWGSIKREKI